MLDSITDIPGIKVGHYTDLKAATGCTVVLCPKGAVAGVDVRGSAPGTRETDTLRPINAVSRAHAVLLTGGSAFGLDAAGGVMKFLEEGGFGFDVGVARVPIVPAAVLLDLFIGNPKVRPNFGDGYRACLAASDNEASGGNVGAGTGATVGKLLGHDHMMKGGLGTASARVGKNIIVGAIVAVNAFGDVVEPATGKIIAGARASGEHQFANTMDYLRSHAVIPGIPRRGTTIGVVATNALLDKIQVNKIAQMAQDGLALAVRPVHMMFDGDTIFSLATGQVTERVDASVVGAAAVEITARAIVKAVVAAEELCGVPSARAFGYQIPA
ncbi:MAG: P1 family peptidase [Chloroflexi bacterium]|nr:P1 family peptidase [Chloroflexota bacterium]